MLCSVPFCGCATCFPRLTNSKEKNSSLDVYKRQAEDTREKIDIVQLNAEIAQIVAREEVLRAEIDKIIAEIEVDA